MKIGDYVTRDSYNNDIVFKIISINNNTAILSGARVRLVADSRVDDLKVYSEDISSDVIDISLDENVINGVVLHIDGDRDYLDECMKFYKKNKIPAIGYFVDEERMPYVIEYLISKHMPDILVLTGHDGIKNGRYINSKYYCDSIIKARRLESNKDNLIIISGGCFSDYISLIKGGANFASSPKSVVIDVLDPAKIAGLVSCGLASSYLDIDKIIDATMNKNKGIGGIDTKGTARKVY